MKIDSVEIKNFRSIKDITIDFNERSSYILIGVNESGKSNILKALSYLGEIKPSSSECRILLPDEDPDKNSESIIDFNFIFDEEDINELISKVLLHFVDFEDFTKIGIVSNNRKLYSIDLLCKEISKACYRINFKKETKEHLYYQFDKNYRLMSTFYIATSQFTYKNQSDNSFNINPGNVMHLSKDELLNTKLADFVKALTLKDLEEIIGKEIVNVFKNKKPNCIFWFYNDKYLLPNSINIKNFCENPSICEPLKNMFEIAKILNISKVINDSLSSGSRNDIINLLDRVATNTTKYFNNIWRTHNFIEFALRIDGENIVPGIKETNTFDLANRSDGFKRFVVFMLMISAAINNKKIENTLILFDEPDIGLDPSAKKFLRDELINISKNNYVIYSTHSIFMIDGNDLYRHIIVERNKEITTISTREESYIVNEEDLYHVLGYSIFETIKERNIIFEGYLDKKMLEIALKEIPSEFKAKLQEYKNIGVCHANKVSNIRNITPLLELAKRKVIAVSDADAPAKLKQKEFNKDKLYGEWIRYDELLQKLKVKDITVVTVEDFINKSYIQTSYKDYIEKINNNKIINSNIIFDNSIGVLNKIEDELNKLEIKDSDEKKKFVTGFKDYLFDNLTANNIINEYYLCLQILLTKFSK